MEVKEDTGKRNYGKLGCFVAVIILVVLLVLFFTGTINYPWNR